MRAGTLSYDMAHLLGGAALVLSFVLLYQRRVRACVTAYALQAWALALAAGWQGWVQGEPQLYLTALVTLAAKGVLLPLALARIADRLGLRGAAETALGVFASMLLGLVFVALAILVVRPATLGSGADTLTHEDLAFALSVVLLGLLVMITRRNALLQVVGFLSLENGLILAAVGVRGMPMVVELAIAVLVMVAFAVFGVFFFRIRERFDSLDVAELERVGRLRG